MLLLLVQPTVRRPLMLAGQAAGMARDGGAAAQVEAISGTTALADLGGGTVYP